MDDHIPLWISDRVLVVLLLLSTIALTMTHLYNTYVLRRIEAREKQTQIDLQERTYELEARAETVALAIKTEAERVAAEAQVRHEQVIETSVEARAETRQVTATVEQLVATLVERNYELIKDTHRMVMSIEHKITPP